MQKSTYFGIRYVVNPKIKGTHYLKNIYITMKMNLIFCTSKTWSNFNRGKPNARYYFPSPAQM